MKVLSSGVRTKFQKMGFNICFDSCRFLGLMCLKITLDLQMSFTRIFQGWIELRDSVDSVLFLVVSLGVGGVVKKGVLANWKASLTLGLPNAVKRVALASTHQKLLPINNI